MKFCRAVPLMPAACALQSFIRCCCGLSAAWPGLAEKPAMPPTTINAKRDNRILVTPTPSRPAALLDHLVGSRQNRWRNRQPERLGGLQLDRELVTRRTRNGQFARRCAAKDARN